MANIHSSRDPYVVAVYVTTASGGLGRFVRGVRKSGKVMEGTGGAARVLGRIRAGLTPAQIAENYRELFPEHTIHVSLRADEPVETAEHAERRKRAKIRRREKAAEKLTATLAVEATILGEFPDAALFAGLGQNVTVSYVAERLRKESPPENGTLRYIYDMARFNAGNGYLGTAIQARWNLPTGYPEDRKAILDRLADQVAEVLAPGASMNAARAWKRALG